LLPPRRRQNRVRQRFQPVLAGAAGRYNLSRPGAGPGDSTTAVVAAGHAVRTGDRRNRKHPGPAAVNAVTRKMRGQAMTEFVVSAAFVLVPLFIIIPILGKYVDMKHMAVQAARYEAWEYTVNYQDIEDEQPSN